MDKLRAIQCFIAVAEASSFSEAARKLNVSAPSITRLVNELEDELGVLLLHRTTRSVSLTEVGARYLEDARSIVGDLESADDAAKGAHGTPRGTLRITASTMFGALHVAPIITAYLNHYPDVEVDAVFLDRVVNIVEEDIDVAIRIGKLQDSSLIATRVGRVQLQVCGSPLYFERHGRPQNPGELLQHRTVGFALGNMQAGWRFRNDETIKPHHRVQFNSIPAALNAARSGWGLVRALSYQIGADLQTGALETVLSDYAPSELPVHVIHRQGRRASAKVRAFVDLAVEALRSNPML